MEINSELNYNYPFTLILDYVILCVQEYSVTLKDSESYTLGDPPLVIPVDFKVTKNCYYTTEKSLSYTGSWASLIDDEITIEAASMSVTPGAY